MTKYYICPNHDDYMIPHEICPKCFSKTKLNWECPDNLEIYFDCEQHQKERLEHAEWLQMHRYEHVQRSA